MRDFKYHSGVGHAQRSIMPFMNYQDSCQAEHHRTHQSHEASDGVLFEYQRKWIGIGTKP